MKYQLACDIVINTDLRYQWTSKVLEEVGGGGEEGRKGRYENEDEWEEKGREEMK